MPITDECHTMCLETATQLQGSERRLGMARLVKSLGTGGQRRAAPACGWSRDTIRLGMQALTSGFRGQDPVSGRGRKRAEEHLPHFLTDIRDLVDGPSQPDPTCATTRRLTRVRAAAVRRQLLTTKGSTEADLPTEETLRVTRHTLGYSPRRGQQSRPHTTSPDTDAMCDAFSPGHAEAAQEETVLRVSMDAKATGVMGPFSRGGPSRVEVHALDHDVCPEDTRTPCGLSCPDHHENALFLTSSVVTSAGMVDGLCAVWLRVHERFPHVTTLLLKQDKGPENQSRRTQFRPSMAACAATPHRTIHVAASPPSPRKYHPIERVGGVLENSWHGSVLDSVDMVLNLASKMTWNGQHPVVTLVKKTSQTGVKLTQKAMAVFEQRFQRLLHLPKWFVKLSPVSS